jgi:glycine cleavage system H lipoate-binding protein
MRCPFLREALVKYCQASAHRKMIVDAARDAGHERCSSSSWPSCPAAARHANPHDEQPEELCPFLHDARVEFCGGAAVPRFVPASDALLSHCNSDAHRFCEVFLAHADPTGERLVQPAAARRRDASGAPLVDGIPMPLNLAYAPNHMWLDVGDDGCRHVGIDAFLARVVGEVDAISFVVPRGDGRPVAVLTVNGVDLQLVFPVALRRAAANVYLRTSPAKLTSDPYGAGWLFESVEPCASADEASAGFRRGDEASRWMLTESSRLALHVHETLARRGSEGARFMADGGVPCANLAAHLERGELLDLFNQFFSLHTTGRIS